MSSSPEPCSSCSKSIQETTEVISNYAESIIDDYDVFDPEELRNKQMFEKPRGEKRWLGRERHRGKERLHNSVKNRTFIEKTLKSDEPLSKNAIKRVTETTNDQLELNVIYSLDKKKRWQTADTTSLLGAAPECVNAEVVERNALETCGYVHSDKSTFAVHSKQINLNKEAGDFEVRSATSSGKGQHYSNFSPKTREFSKEASARKMNTQVEDHVLEKEVEHQPTVSYNIYKTHPSREVVGSQMFKPKVLSKSGRHRVNQKLELEDYDDDDKEFDEDEDETEGNFEQTPPQCVLDLSACIIENRDKKSRKHGRKDCYMFEEFEITFSNQEETFEHQIDELRRECKLIVKDLRPTQYLIDASEWCQLDGEVKDGEITTVIVITHLKKNTYNFLINSTIPISPADRNLEKLIKRLSYVKTFKEAVSKITSDILTNRRTFDTMRMSSMFYGRKTVSDLLQDPEEWENQLVNLKWPNQHYNATWANSEELSQVGAKLEWNDLCATIKKENRLKTGYTSDDMCELCHQRKRSHELFLVDDENKLKCTECLREEFYRELRARRVPIDLKTDTADELEYLPTFIPLTILNLYVRMVSETIYKDLGAAGDFEKCPSCKSAVFFKEIPSGNEKKSQNRSCPCGYSWCKHCGRVPHWPMKCGEYAEWEEKWLLRYAMRHAQGTGTDTLLQVTCSCAKEVYHVLLPEEFIECPGCKTNVNMNTMRTVWKHYYYPFDPILRKYIKKGYYVIGEDYKKSPYVPRAKVYTEIVKIPGIRASVIEICGDARDIRYDIHSRNRAVNREHILIRKKVMEREVVENLLGTSVYLVENVTAWMYMSSQYDRNVKKTLESVMENRKNLLSSLEGEDSEAISECINKLRKDINNVVTAVEKKFSEAQDL
ncbi:hypothetical protein CRE_27206 [Caenorhabditis remanei]|uniref:IBR domain-containing protein n=1 Tax=Caenorhabditis remanei TaxID=31234 RepID=E3LP21_CAERE|nr:hypothetical protein CRE_27206 [Caenorhabditis remanei]